MSKFLRVALSSSTPGGDDTLAPTSSNPTRCLSSAFPEPSAYEAFDSLFRPTMKLPPGAWPPTRRWKAEIDPDDDDEQFAFKCKSTQFESVDVGYTLQDLQGVIPSTTLNELDLDSQLPNRQSDFEMVRFTFHVSCVFARLREDVLAFGTGTASDSPVQFPRFGTFCLHA
jgi:hypothetical protein